MRDDVHSLTTTPPAASPQTLVAAMHRILARLDPKIEAAFLRIPRHYFLPEQTLERVYSDQAVATKLHDGIVISSSSQPSMMAMMLGQLDLHEGDNVMEIGAGTGYNAAIMMALVGDTGYVTSVEIDPQVADDATTHLQHAAMRAVTLVVGDGANGYAPRAAYDRIIATAACWDVPRTWVRQLRPNGKLVAPIWIEGFQMSAALSPQRDGTLYSQDNIVCSFVWMQEQQKRQITYRIPGGLFLDCNSHIDGVALAQLLGDDAEDGYLAGVPSTASLWLGFLPYLILHPPPQLQIANYISLNNVYGIDGTGFALLLPGSACFVQLGVHPKVRYFGGADAYLALQDELSAWDNAGRPDQRNVRIRFIPLDSQAQTAEDLPGRVFERTDHLLQVWMDMD